MLEITTSHQSSKLVVQLSGRIDAASAKDLEQQVVKLIQDGEHHLILDFGQVDYISSAGLRVVLLVGKQLNAKQGSYRLCNLNDIILNVFEISGFSKLFTICASLEEALSV